MSGHLEILKEMFPQKLFLDVSDIAKCLNLSKGHVYNLSSAKKLPFILDDHSDKVQVSIVAMARYLDSKIEVNPSPIIVEEESIPVPDLIKPKKKGRPRNSQRVQLAFQSSLQIAIVQEEVSYIFSDMQEKIESLEFNGSEEVSCSDKFNEAKDNFSQFASYGQKYMAHAFMNLKFGMKPKEKLKKEF
jgi:hypothetical protein